MRKDFFHETIKARARLIEQALDLRSWSDARGSQAQEKKRRERLKMGKKHATRMGKERTPAGEPNVPHSEVKKSRHAGKAALTVLHMPPTFAPPRAEENEKNGNRDGGDGDERELGGGSADRRRSSSNHRPRAQIWDIYPVYVLVASVSHGRSRFALTRNDLVTLTLAVAPNESHSVPQAASRPERSSTECRFVVPYI